MRHNAFSDQIRLSRRFAGRFIASVIALAVATAAGCSSIDYQKLTTGEISGSLFVMWVGEGNSSGDGNFLFVPDPQEPLIFHRGDPTAPGSKIKPGLMYTDGGSIPKIAQVFKGLSPWGYAPAYMIHDWIFIAHHCIVDGSTEKRFDQVRGVEFDDSAAILGEAIKALIATRQVAPNDVAPSAITAAVGSAIAKNLWDEKGACKSLQVSAKDIASAEAAIPGSTSKAQNLRTFQIPETVAPVVRAVRPAKIIARLSF
ncbi:hypothetical protein FJ872_03025 [Mesorhizobium sp. B2-5-9]|uniref:hypothetical protein n=1 Tax=Mesorhizobium sp. B2-5-9 TaxID=2589921 RepID=UPI00112AB97C|nr:hypothetical protein [Mesorhizobium sp. B2-5-9]TPK23947.1 hypothetical protein FJ872_02530 [Mesorhizobium sp. B2-5-9]TPK24024.1 hypothetical protein FJ872_03025 [Mesorhizobium sp. B2-5-9]